MSGLFDIDTTTATLAVPAKQKPAPAPVVCPFTVLVDGREKAAYTFTGMTADANKNHRPLEITTKWAHLKTGDYSIEDMADLVCVERKSLEDLYSTLGQHRDRFQAEHERMTGFAFACVVIEASMERAVKQPPERSRLNPKAVYRTCLSWQMRYGVPWMWVEDRRLGEITTFRILETFWKQQQKQKKEMEG